MFQNSPPRSLPARPLAARALGIAILLVLGPGLAARLAASLVEERSLLELYRSSGVIFHGKCVAKKEVPGGEPLPYTEYTFEVIEAVRGCKDAAGQTVRTITFRHAGARKGLVRADGLEEAPLRLGIPEHEVGEESVLFLTKESSLGLCAPVGLDQGKLRVVREQGAAFVQSARRAALFQKVDATAFRAPTQAEGNLLRSTGDKLDLKCFLGLCSKVKE